LWKSIRRSPVRVLETNAVKPRKRPALSLESLEDRIAPAVVELDLVTRGSMVTANNAIFKQADPQPTGTGVINSFVRIQAQGSSQTVEQGYNTNARPVQFDEKANTNFDRAIHLSEVPQVAIDGKPYREFMVDINQNSKNPYLSLDEFRVYVANVPDLKGYNTTTKTLGGYSAVYNLDDGVDKFLKLNYRLNPGSGGGDMFAYVPDQLFQGTLSSDPYVYLYSKFGKQAGATSNAGFEEWACRKPSVVTPPSTISGFAYNDSNNNGVKDTGELGLGGVKLQLTGVNDLGYPVSVIAVTTPTGVFSFPNLRPGTYQVTEVQPTGYLDGKATAGSLGGTTVSNTISNVTISTTNSTLTNYNFGDLLPASVGGKVYTDVNNDGLYATTEPPVIGATVTLTGVTDQGSNVTFTTTTDSTGSFNFTNLRPGTYTVTETQPAGYLDGKDAVGTPTGTVSNDVLGNIVVQAGATITGDNFGELAPNTISGSVFSDANNNGVREAGDTGISGATVALTGTNDLSQNVTQTAVTDVNGNYSFTDLRPGTYTVTETQPPNYLDGTDKAGSSNGTAGNDVISSIKLVSGTSAAGENFGEVAAPTLSGVVYVDNNVNGTYDSGADSGISGVTITLTGTDDLGHNVNVTTTTDSNGTYSFTGLRPGTYTVTETQPDTYPDAHDSVGNLGGTATNDVVSNIVLQPATTGQGYNFGELSNAVGALSGHVWLDADKNGNFDGNESGIAGVNIVLTGTDFNGNSVFQAVQTDGNGFYHFDNLAQGTYSISEAQPVGFDDGADNIGSQSGSSSNDLFYNISLNGGVNGVNNDFGELLVAGSN